MAGSAGVLIRLGAGVPEQEPGDAGVGEESDQGTYEVGAC